MKIVRHFLLLFATVCGAVFTYAQSADEILGKHIEAIGGKELLSKINSLRLENTMEVMGNQAPSTTTVLVGKGFRNESEFNGQKVVQVYTDKGGWAINPFAGSEDPQAMPEEQYKAGKDQIYIDPFLDYVSRGSKAELLGQEKVGDINAYKIKFTNKDSASTTFYFDPSTFYILKSVRQAEMMGQQMDLTATYSDYKKTDYGLVTPQSILINIGDQFSMTSKLQKIEVNTPVDASIFEMKK
jgi:hypothetical protein